MTVAKATIRIAEEIYIKFSGSPSLSWRIIKRASAVIAITNG